MSLDTTPIPLPCDPRHQRFADLVLAGEPAAKAYKEAGFNAKTPQSRATNASRLLKRADVSAYIAAIQSQAADASVMTLLERRRFYARIVRTPLMSIDPDAKDFKHGDLIKKFKRTNTESGETWEIEKLDPLKACELDTKAAGEDAGDNLLGELAEALMSLPKVHSKM
ncbi:MAG: Terminase small subunit [Verrucomicrobiota bacterium]|jgi:hypothetical protein